jgi:peroxiredoxin
VQLQEASDTLAAHGGKVVAIVVDARETNAALADRLGVRYPILSDPELATIRAWGVEDEGKDIALPSTVVIDGEGRVAWSYVGDRPGDRPLVDHVITVLKALPGARQGTSEDGMP